MYATYRSTISLALTGTLALAVVATTAPALAITQPAHATCTSRHSDAEMMSYFAPHRPLFAEYAGYFGTTVVRIDLDAAGSVWSTSVIKSSGYQVLDADALRTVRAAKFVPEKTDCQGIPSSYQTDVSYEE